LLLESIRRWDIFIDESGKNDLTWQSSARQGQNPNVLPVDVENRS